MIRIYLQGPWWVLLAPSALLLLVYGTVVAAGAAKDAVGRRRAKKWARERPR